MDYQYIYDIILPFVNFDDINKLYNMCKIGRKQLNVQFVSLLKIYYSVKSNVKQFKKKTICTYESIYSENFFCIKFTKDFVATSLFNFNDDPKIYKCELVEKDIYYTSDSIYLEKDIYIVVKYNKINNEFELKYENDRYYGAFVHLAIIKTLNSDLKMLNYNENVFYTRNYKLELLYKSLIHTLNKYCMNL